MKYLQSGILLVICGLALTAGPAAAAPRAVSYQHLRGVVDQTQNDLQQAELTAQSAAAHKRFDNAQQKLATFDRGLAKGHYHPGALKAAISALNNVLAHNVLEPYIRDALNADRGDLQRYYNAHP